MTYSPEQGQRFEIAKDVYCALLSTLTDVYKSPLSEKEYGFIAKQSIKAYEAFIEVSLTEGLIK